MEEGWHLTEKGLYQAIEMHQKILDGWTLEQVAAFYEQDVEVVRVLLAIFYYVADSNNVDLGIYVPDYYPEGMVD